MKNSNNGFLAILMAAVIYGAFGSLVRFSSEAFGSFTQGVLRSLIVLAVALLLIWKGKGSLKLESGQLFKSLLLGVVFFLAIQAFTFASLMTKISVVVFMIYVGAFTTSFFIGWLFFKEKINATKLISLLVVSLGLLFTVQFNFLDVSLGVALGIACGVCDAISNAILKSISSENKDAIVFYKFLMSLVGGLIIVMLIGEAPFKTVTLISIVIISISGIGMVVANHLLMIGFKKFDFTKGQIVLSTEIFFAIIFGIIFFLEIPAWYELVGGVLIFIGATLVNFDLAKLLKSNTKKS